MFQVAPGANKIEIKRAVEQLLGSKVASIRTSIAHGKVKRQGRFAGRRSDWKKAYVKLREGEKMPEFLEGAQSKSIMPIRKYNPTSPGTRFQTVQTFDEITTPEPHKPLVEPLHSIGRPQQPRAADVVVARRRPQADVPHHRLQARQARHSGEGRRRSSTTRTARRASRC